MKLLACKHASSSSCTQKMADVCRSFAIVKHMTKVTSAVNLPSGFGLKGQIEYELDRLYAQGILVPKLIARKAIVNHTVNFPDTFGKVKKYTLTLIFLGC